MVPVYDILKMVQWEKYYYGIRLSLISAYSKKKVLQRENNKIQYYKFQQQWLFKTLCLMNKYCSPKGKTDLPEKKPVMPEISKDTTRM